MEDWKIQKVDKLFALGRGRVINDEEIKNNLGDYPVYSSQTFNNGEFGRVNFFEFEGNYITWTTDGANAGKVFFREGRFNCTNVCGTLRAINEDLTNTKFFAYLLEREAFKHVAVVGNNKLMNNVMAKIKVHYPIHKPEQTAIATLLSKVDEALAATQNSIKAAKKVKKALMQNLLTGKLKPDGSWRTEDEFYEDEKFGKVPLGWEVKSIKQLFDFYPTSSYSRSALIEGGNIGYIHYGDIHTKFDRIIDLSTQTVPFIPDELEKNYEKLKDGDLVVSDASEDWDGVGKSIEIINSQGKKVIAGLHTLHLRPKTNDLILGINGYLMNIYKVSISIKRLATGAKVYGINKSSLSKILLPIPSEPEQIFIKEKLDEIANEIIGKQTKIQTLQRLKKSLMQNLLTGKVRLPETFIAEFKKEIASS